MAWWFTSDCDDIGYDHGITEMQLKEDTDLFFDEDHEVIEIE